MQNLHLVLVHGDTALKEAIARLKKSWVGFAVLAGMHNIVDLITPKVVFSFSFF